MERLDSTSTHLPRNVCELLGVVARIVRTTEAAILVDLERGGEVWIPKSQVEGRGRDYSAGPGNGSMMVSEWWCSKELD